MDSTIALQGLTADYSSDFIESPKDKPVEHARLSDAYPIFANARSGLSSLFNSIRNPWCRDSPNTIVKPPPQWLGAISPELWGIIQYSPSLTLRQHLKPVPRRCCGWPPCIPEANSYSVYAGVETGHEGGSGEGMDRGSAPTVQLEAEVMRVDEVSDDINRCCCKPFHPMKLEFR